MPENAAETAETDLSLLRRFIDTGDTAAFGEIVQRYGRVVYASSLRILGDEGRAQDVSQETFFRLMPAPKLVSHSLGGWLHRTATHLAVDQRRSEIARRRREQIYGRQQQQTTHSAEPTWAEVSPFVDQALNDVKEPTRSLLIRHYLQGIPQADIAADMDVSAATISRRIKSGLDELQQCLRKKGVYLGIAALAVFCADYTTSAAPPAFISELGKMQLIASFRPAVAGPPAPPMTVPPTLKMRWNKEIFVPGKFFALLVAVALLALVYAIAIQASWNQARKNSLQFNSSIENQRVAPEQTQPQRAAP